MVLVVLRLNLLLVVLMVLVVLRLNLLLVVLMVFVVLVVVFMVLVVTVQELLDEVHKSIGGGIMGVHIVVVSEFRLDLIGQLLTELNSPLVKTVDIPHNTLDKDLVLIHGNKSSQSVGVQFLEDDGVGWPVALEYFVWQDLLQVLLADAAGLQLLPGLLGGLSLHQSLCLGKEVGHQDLVVHVVSDGVLGLGGDREVARDHACSLVDELVEGMLPVGA